VVSHSAKSRNAFSFLGGAGRMNNRLHTLFKPRSLRRRIAGATLLRLSLFPLILAACWPSVGQSTQNETCSEPPGTPYTLSPNESLSRNMTRNQRHVFQLSLLPGQYVHLVVDQKGIDVVLRFLDPNRRVLTERDSPNTKVGPEALSAVAQSAGIYYLEVCANRSQPAGGSYQLKVLGPRAGSPADDKRVAAEHLLMEGGRLASQRTEESHQRAIEEFQRAVEIWREIGDVREEGYALCSIGETYRFLKNFKEAKHYLDQALSRLDEAQEFSGQAYVLNQLGAAHRDLDDKRKAFGNYSQALELRTRIGDRWGQANILNNVGFLHSEIGEQKESIANSELALPIWREVEDRAMELNTLNNIAKAHLDLGNLTTALQTFQMILDSCTQVPKPCNLEPYARNSRGIIHDILGESTEALEEYRLALNLFRDARNKGEEAKVLNNIGMVYAGIGDASTALEHFQEALKICEGDPNHFFEDVTRSNIGYAQIISGNYSEALGQLEQAYTLSKASHNQRFEAYTLMRKGAVQLALHQLENALASYNQALEIQNRIDDRRGQAITLDKLGELYSLREQPAQALKNYEEALERWKFLADEQGEALSLYGMARVERKQNRLENARKRIVEAIEKVESLRTRMTSHRLRLTYFAAKRDFYELEIDIRMRLYNATGSKTELELALHASERARGRNLLDLLNESHADIRQGVDPQLLNLERTQLAQLTEKQSQLLTLLSKKHSNEERNAIERELDSLTRSFDQTQAEIRKRSPQYAGLTQPQPLKLAQIQQLLDDNTVLLEYALGEEQSYLWLVTRADVQAYTLPGRVKIEAVAESFRESLRAWEPKKAGEDEFKYIAKLRGASANYQQRAVEFSNIVLGRASSMLGNKRLVIVADGALQYVSFSALRIANETGVANSTPSALIGEHEIVYQPSASALALVRAVSRPVPTKALAVFADPVFDKTDERVRDGPNTSKNDPAAPTLPRETKWALRDAGDIDSVDGVLRLERLRHTRREADAIVAAARPGSSMKAVDFDANRDHVLKQRLNHFRVIHLATHGILNGRNPELSGLVFSLVDKRGRSEDGFLRLADIYNMNLPVEMVVLSGCQTGVGKQVKGEGLIGLTRGFMYAGAARVVASLWRVDDEATAELMKRFYSHMLEGKMPAAAALRQAQLDYMKIRPEPYYWAGFVLQGEWR
jgi:CHAT domain-containing protein/Flp pilus assembly protein TadD